MPRPVIVALVVCMASVAHAAPPIEPSDVDAPPPSPEAVDEPAAPPPTPPPTPPAPPPEKPRAVPVDSVGGFDWTALGFVRRDGVDPEADHAESHVSRIPKLHDRSGLTLGTVRALASAVAFRPVSQAEDTRIDAFEATFGGGVEFRRSGRVLAPWLDGELGVTTGSKDERGPDGELTGRGFSIFSLRIQALAGLDFWLAQPVSIGPVAGYRMELLTVSDPGDVTASSQGVMGHALVAGGHLRLATEHTVQAPPWLALDVRVESRTSTFGTATYGNALLGVRLGIVRLLAQIERRFSAPEPGEPSSDLATASLEGTPFEQRVGAGAALVFF